MTVTVKVQGLKEFRRDLRRVDTGAAMRDAHRRSAELLADRSKGAAPSHVDRAVSHRGGQREGVVRVGGQPPHALGTVLGAKQKFGWYALPPYRASTGRQFPPWVGSQWDPGESGAAPYHIGPAINRSVDDVADIFGDEFERAARPAFPRGT